MDTPWKKLNSKIDYTAPNFVVRVDEVERPGGTVKPYEYVDRLDFAVPIAVDKDEKIIFTRQWRYLMNHYSWELPRGAREKGETIEESGQRELREETGVTANSWQDIGGFYVTASYSNQACRVYIVSDLKFGETQLDTDEEGLTMEKFTVDEIKQMISQGEIMCGITIAAFTYYLLNK